MATLLVPSRGLSFDKGSDHDLEKSPSSPVNHWRYSRSEASADDATYILSSDRFEEDSIECHRRSPEPIDQDTFGAGLVSIVRDTHWIAVGSENILMRGGRLATSLLLIVFTLSLQVWLLMETKMFVSASAVHHIRETYDKYELFMYGAELGHTTLTADGQHRGVAEFFHPERFESLSEDMKHDICRIPFSQPFFLLPVLLTWALCVVSDLRRALDLTHRFLIATPTAHDMAHMLRFGQRDSEEHNEVLVRSLTLPVKGLLLVIIFLPRIVLCSVLLWLGSRWLTATQSFGNLLVNAVALQFILSLKDLLYTTVPSRHQRETSSTLMLPQTKRERPTCWGYTDSIFYFAFSVAWPIIYMYKLQQVLPEYQWDVHGQCIGYIREITRV